MHQSTRALRARLANRFALRQRFMHSVMRKNQSLSIALLSFLAATAAEAIGDSRVVPQCNPTPKLIHAESVPDDREARAPHEGRVLVAVTIDIKGHVRDPVIIESSDDWFNDVSLKSVLLWRFQPPKKKCRAQVPIEYKLSKDNR